MRATLAGRPLNQIVMPGSHDARTYAFHEVSNALDGLPPALQMAVGTIARLLGVAADAAIARFAQCQQFDLGGQLRSGSRFLDLRAEYFHDLHDFRLYHGDFRTSVRLDDNFRMHTINLNAHCQPALRAGGVNFLRVSDAVRDRRQRPKECRSSTDRPQPGGQASNVGS
jgi:hypothetical protein